MNDKFKDFWLEKSKEEIINAYRECINNGEVLLARIDKAINFIEEECFDYEFNCCWDLVGNDIYKVLDILKGCDNNVNSSDNL